MWTTQPRYLLPSSFFTLRAKKEDFAPFGAFEFQGDAPDRARRSAPHLPPWTELIMAHGRARKHIHAHTSTNRAFRLTFDGLLVLGLSFLCDGFLVLSKKPREQAATCIALSLQPARVSWAERRSNSPDAKPTGTRRVGLNETARDGHREEEHCSLHSHSLSSSTKFQSNFIFFTPKEEYTNKTVGGQGKAEFSHGPHAPT